MVMRARGNSGTLNGLVGVTKASGLRDTNLIHKGDIAYHNYLLRAVMNPFQITLFSDIVLLWGLPHLH